MVFTPHMIAGAVVGAKVSNIGLAFLLSLISHYLLDMLPHWEYPAGIVKGSKQILWLMSDFLLGWMIVFMLVGRELLALDFKTLVILGSVFFAELPDLFLFLEFNFKTKWTRPLVKTHHQIHNPKKYGFLKALPVFLLLFALAIWILRGGGG